MAIKTAIKLIVAIGIGLVAVAAAWTAAAITMADDRMLPASKGVGFKLGIQHALTADHAHAIWSGHVPTIVFRGREYESINRYTWEKANLQRPGNCVDLKRATDGKGYALSTLCRPRAKLEENGNRFYFLVTEDKAIRLGVGTKRPTDGRIEGRGAMFGVEGEIGFGTNFDTASVFKIELTAIGMNTADLHAKPLPNVTPEIEGDEKAGGCSKPRTVGLDEPITLRLLPPTTARICGFRSKDNRTVLSLVQFQRGWMQYSIWTDEFMCRALLAALLDADRTRNTNFAGCIGAHWNEVGRIDVNLTLFEMPKPGRLARLVY